MTTDHFSPDRPIPITPAGTDPFKADLVLEGGGVKGIALAGAVLELDGAGYRFPRVAGTSAGAIAAALIAALNAAGEPVARLDEVLRSLDYEKFVADGPVRAGLRLLVRLGLYDESYLVDWLGGWLERIGPTTFGDLRLDDTGADRNLTPEQRYTLVLLTSDLTRGRLVRLPWDYPRYGTTDIDAVRIVDAVHASAAVPFFFTPVRFTAPAARFDGVDYARSSIVWVDGGLLSNFPVEVFDRTDGQPSRWRTLGIKLSGRGAVVPAGRPIRTLLDEGIAVVRTLLNNADRYYVSSEKARRTVFVDTQAVATLDFGLGAAEQDQLFAGGQRAARDWLAHHAAGAAPISR